MALAPAVARGRRLREKTPACFRVQASLPEPLKLDVNDEASTDSKRQVYLITLPCPKPGAVSSDGRPLTAPGSKTKEEVLACVLDAFAHPVYTNVWLAHGPVPLKQLGLWREFHKPGPAQERSVHDHLPALAVDNCTFRYLPVKRALLQRHGLASHWSCSHTGYWSCVRYLAVESPKKPEESLDKNPVLWARHGTHPHVVDCTYAPVTAGALTAKRQKLASQAARNGKAEPKVNDLDVWALVVRSGVRNDIDDQTAHMQLAAYAKQHCGETMVHYLFKRRHVLSRMIDDIWLWENIENAVLVARRSRLEALTAAELGPCTCGGAWPAFVVSSFIQNGIPIAELCHDVLTALTRGRSETTPVLVLGGRLGGEGKSMFVKPLRRIYDGFVFATPERSNFPLMDLPHAKVALLEEFPWDDDLVSWAAMNLWFDGSAVPIGQPQNVPGATGNIEYKGKAPIFITCKLSDLERLEYYAQINPSTGDPWEANASMINRRLKVYRFTQRVAKPREQISFCAHCFAKFVKSQAAVWAESQQR